MSRGGGLPSPKPGEKPATWSGLEHHLRGIHPTAVCCRELAVMGPYDIQDVRTLCRLMTKAGTLTVDHIVSVAGGDPPLGTVFYRYVMLKDRPTL